MEIFSIDPYIVGPILGIGILLFSLLSVTPWAEGMIESSVVTWHGQCNAYRREEKYISH